MMIILKYMNYIHFPKKFDYIIKLILNYIISGILKDNHENLRIK